MAKLFGGKKRNTGKTSAPKKRPNGKVMAIDAKNQGSELVTANGGGDYKMRLARRRRKNLIRMLAGAGAALAAALGIYLFVTNHAYRSYEVVAVSEQEDTVATQYIEMDDKLFKYSSDGVALEENDGTLIWNSTYEMQNPVADVCDSVVVVADQGGTAMRIYNKEGEVGQIETGLNIVKAKAAKQGVVAAILDGGDDTWINFYSTDGTLIAENQTRVDDPGYPLDLAVSPDGMLIAVAYQFVDGGETTSYVAYYNFGTAGQNQIDNIVSGYQYQGVVVPQVEYIDASTSVAFRDDGFSVFRGKQIPKESANVVVEKEIVSTFYDEDHIGLVFKNDEKDKLYTMNVYNADGKLSFEKDFNIPYTNINMSKGSIVMNNDSQVCVISDKGVEKYNGNIDEGTINDFFKVGYNKYVVVLDSGISTIKFK